VEAQTGSAVGAEFGQTPDRAQVGHLAAVQRKVLQVGQTGEGGKVADGGLDEVQHLQSGEAGE